MRRNSKLFKNVTLAVVVNFLWSNVIWAGGADFIAQAAQPTDTLAAQTQAAAIGLAVRADVDALVMTKVLRALKITNMGALVNSFEKGKDPFGRPCLISGENEKKIAYYYFEQGKRKYQRVTTEENVNDLLNRLLQALNPVCAPGVVIRAGGLFEQGWLISEGQEEVFDSFLGIIYPGMIIAGVPSAAGLPVKTGTTGTIGVTNKKGLFNFETAVVSIITAAAWIWRGWLSAHSGLLIIAAAGAVLYGLFKFGTVTRREYIPARFVLTTKRFPGLRPAALALLLSFAPGCAGYISTQETFREVKTSKVSGVVGRILNIISDLINTGDEDINYKDIKAGYKAIEILGVLKDRSAVPFLLSLLKNPDSFMRSNAADALGEIGDKSAINNLLDALDEGNEEEDVRLSIMKALGKIGDKSKPVISALKKIWLNEYGNLTVHIKAAHALALLGQGDLVYDKVIGFLGKRDPEKESIQNEELAEVLETLGVIGNTSALGAALSLTVDFRREPYRIREGVVKMLGYMGQENAEAISPFLLGIAIKDPGHMVKAATAEALGRLNYKPSIPVLRNLLGAPNEHPYAKLYAAQALIRLGDKDEWALRYLEGMLKNPDMYIITMRVLYDLGYRFYAKAGNWADSMPVSLYLGVEKEHPEDHTEGTRYASVIDGVMAKPIRRTAALAAASLPRRLDDSKKKLREEGKPTAAAGTAASLPVGVPSSLPVRPLASQPIQPSASQPIQTLASQPSEPPASQPASRPSGAPAFQPNGILAAQPGKIQTQYNRHVRQEDEKPVMILDVEHTGILGGIKEEGNLERLREILAKTLGRQITAEEARDIARQKIQDSLDRIKNKYQTGIFGAANQVVLVDNLGGIDSDGAAAELRDGRIFIDIDAFRNDRARDDITKHEFYERILKLVEKNPGVAEVTAIYQNLKDFAELQPPEKTDLVNFLSNKKNGLNSAEYGAVLKYISDNNITGDELITLAIGYVAGTARYARLRESLKGVLPGDIKNAEQKLKLAENIYTDLINARNVAKEALSGVTDGLKPIIEAAKTAEAKAKILMKVRMTVSRLNTLADFVNRLYADNRYVRLDMDELAKPGNEYIMQWLEGLLSGRMEEKYPFILFSSGGRTTLADLLARYQKLSAGKFLGDSDIIDRQIPKENIATLYDLGSNEPNADARRKTLSVPLLYSDIGIYLAAEVAIAGGDISKISNPLIRNTLEAFYEPLFGEGISAEVLIRLFKGEIWPPLEKITTLLNQDALRKAIAKAELEAAA